MIKLEIYGKGYDGDVDAFIKDVIEKLPKLRSQIAGEEPECDPEEDEEFEDEGVEEESDKDVVELPEEVEKTIIKKILSSMFGTDDIEIHKVSDMNAGCGTKNCAGKCPHGKTCHTPKPVKDPEPVEDFEDIGQID